MTDELTRAETREFHARIDAAIEDICDLLPGLAERYSIMEILCAFNEHVGGAFLALRRGKIFTDAQTIKMIEMVERLAFRKPLR